MAGEPVMTVVGNLAGDPELRFTQNGDAVANFTIAQTPRNFDRQSNQWQDDETLWVRASVWREAAENVAETLTKGTRVVATGKLKARSFEDKEGNQRTNWELTVEEIGPSLRWATAMVNKTGGGGGGGNYQQGGGQQGGYAANDPWAQSQYNQPPQQAQGGQWGQQGQYPPQQGQQVGQPPMQQGQPPMQQGGAWGNPQGQPQQQPQGGQPPQGAPQGQQGQSQPPAFNAWQGGPGEGAPSF